MVARPDPPAGVTQRFEIPAGHASRWDECGLLHFVRWGAHSIDLSWPWWTPGGLVEDEMDGEIDVTNKFLVAAQGGEIVFLRPVPQRVSHQDALLLAAYLVAMVGDDAQWAATKTAVENT